MLSCAATLPENSVQSPATADTPSRCKRVLRVLFLLRESVRAAGLFCNLLMSISIPRSAKTKTMTEPGLRNDFIDEQTHYRCNEAALQASAGRSDGKILSRSFVDIGTSAFWAAHG